EKAAGERSVGQGGELNWIPQLKAKQRGTFRSKGPEINCGIRAEQTSRRRLLRFFCCGRLWWAVAGLRLSNQSERVKNVCEPLVLLGRRRVVKRRHGKINRVVLVEGESMNSSHNDGFPIFHFI